MLLFPVLTSVMFSDTVYSFLFFCFASKCVLLAMLWEMAGPTLLDFKVNMGL